MLTAELIVQHFNPASREAFMLVDTNGLKTLLIVVTQTYLGIKEHNKQFGVRIKKIIYRSLQDGKLYRDRIYIL